MAEKYSYGDDEAGGEEESLVEKLKRKLPDSFETDELLTSDIDKVSIAILALIILPFVLFAVPQLVLAKDALIVKSGSMEPAIQTGGVVFVYDVPVSQLSEGDVITYRTGPDERTTHRIIGVNKTDETGDSGDGSYQFRTKGDNNPDADPGVVDGEDVVGKVGWDVPYLGYALVYVGSFNAYVFLVIVPALLIMINEVVSIAREIRGMKKEGQEMEAIHTFIIVISLVILGVSVAMLSGFGPEFTEVLDLLQLDPTKFGIIVMGALVLAMVLIGLL